jgi:UDP-glucose 4-epimerase
VRLVGEPRAVGQVFNIGNPHEITIKALAEKIRELTGSASEISLIPYDQAYEQGFEDMQRRVPDISKIAGLIGFEPTIQLDEILQRVIDHFQRH